MCARGRTCLQQTLKTECRNNGDRLVRRGIQPLNERTSIESIASVMAGILLVMGEAERNIARMIERGRSAGNVMDKRQMSRT